MHTNINAMRMFKKINDYNANLRINAQSDSIKKLRKRIVDSLSSIENELMQTKAKNEQDLLNYPMKLNNLDVLENLFCLFVFLCFFIII